MSKRHLIAGAATVALLALTAGADAKADVYEPSSESMTDPIIGPVKNQQAAAAVAQNRIVVVPDGNDYAEALPTTLVLPFRIRAEVTADKWRIKDSFIVVGLAPIVSAGQVGSCCGALNEFDPANFAAAVPHGARKKVDLDSVWTVKAEGTSIANRARNACRNLRQELSQQGLSHDEIFSQDRYTVLPTEFRYVARVGHRNDNHDVNEAGAASIQWKQSQPSFANINVTCQKRPSEVGEKPGRAQVPTGSDDIAMGFQVNQAALAITPKQYNAKCPAKLHLNPTIEATGKGLVKYRFVDQLGNHSQTFQVKFDKSDVKFLDHVIEVDGKGKPKGLGFAAAQPQGGDFGLVAPNDPNLTQGYFQLEVLSPHKKLSNIADYSVKCTNLTGSDDLVAPPDIVKPVIVDGLAGGLPDLFIEDIAFNPLTPYRVVVQITNKGQAKSTPTNIKAIRWTGNVFTVKGTLVPEIPAGQSQTIQVFLSGKADGATAIELRVDDPNRIAESDESNNAYQAK